MALLFRALLFLALCSCVTACGDPQFTGPSPVPSFYTPTPQPPIFIDRTGQQRP